MSRTRLFLHTLPLVALLAACSGGGQQTPLPADPGVAPNGAPGDPGTSPGDPATAPGDPATAPDQVTNPDVLPAPSDSPNQPDASSFSTEVQSAARSTGSFATSGWIEDLFRGGFTLQTGYPHGYIRVYTLPTTRISGGALRVRERVLVSATGSWRTGLKALRVSANGATPATSPPQDTAPQVGGIPAHIATWAYDEYWGTGARGSASEVRQYLSYAQSGLGNAKAANDCAGSNACKSVFYFDPSMYYDMSACGSLSPDAKGIHDRASESWFVHLAGYHDRAHRVQGRYNCRGRTIPVYALNSLEPAVRTYFANYLHAYARNFDDFFLDDTSGQVQSQFYGAGGGFCGGRICSTTEELRSDSAVVQEHGELASALTRANGSAMEGVYNGVNFSNGRANDLAILSSNRHFIGAVCEGCVVSAGRLRPNMYEEVLTTMAEIDRIPNGNYVELSNGALAGGSSAQIIARTVTTAMAWLGYNDGHVIVWPNLEEGTENLAIFPENSIYPASPIETMSSGATDVAATSGVYRREFRTCYNDRRPIGPCAAIVNATGRNVVISPAWLHQSYGHLVTMIGGDIPSGGRIVLNAVRFVPNRTYVGPGQALLIVR